ncbi:hypothetical protein Acr_17g0007250 [Actinidia rufa]|uniref:Uncharacterized protein n=1 Tax=Actinidia rufa TaxID=165716 RepID=A0A7J0G300_9ERIC|nr:hypothetical protein Acr_17g0007250 [Actinidia rufa]
MEEEILLRLRRRLGVILRGISGSQGPKGFEVMGHSRTVFDSRVISRLLGVLPFLDLSNASFLSKCCNKPPALIEYDWQRFETIWDSLELGQFCSVDNAKFFLRSFAFESRLMAFSGRENSEDKSAGVAHVASDKAESHYSRDDSPELRIRSFQALALALARRPGQINDCPPSLGRMHALGELKRMKEDHNATVARLDKEMAEIKAESVLPKNSAIEEYKDSDDFYKAVEWEASQFYGKGFDMCKKQIRCLHPELDIQDLQINTDLVEEEEEEEEEERGERRG